MSSTGAARKKSKKLAIMVVSSLLLVAMVVVATVTFARPKGRPSGDDNQMSASMRTIESICQPTDYKEACVRSLTNATGSNTTDPKALVAIAFQVVVENLHNVFNHSKTLQQARNDPRVAHALDNCQELLDYAIDDLQKSMRQIGVFDITKMEKVVDDLKIWLSAAITYEETCLDGFESTPGDVGASMRQAMNTTAQLTSNALAIVDGLSNLLTELDLPFYHRRKLLFEEDATEEEEREVAKDGFPEWVSGTKRKLLAAGSVSEMKPNAVVAKDGSGDFKTITEALSTVPKKSNDTFVIHIKAGVYKEYVQVERSMTNVVMVGDGPLKTRVTGNKNFIDGTPTFKTATVAVIGEGFIAMNIGFENSAGPEKHQAVALRVQSDRSVFYNCHMDGYQDTLYAHAQRQFYRDCTITGTIDFIFGDGAAVLQNCIMKVRKPMENQRNIVTAQGRKDSREPTGLVLHNCTITADPAYFPVRHKLPTFLGRPWKEFSRTIIAQSQFDDLVHTDGWLPWEGEFALKTCYYAEFDNRGPGANMASRVKWPGIKTIGFNDVERFSVENFIGGATWLRSTGVPFIPGLLPVSSTKPSPSRGSSEGVVGPPGAPPKGA